MVNQLKSFHSLPKLVFVTLQTCTVGNALEESLLNTSVCTRISNPILFQMRLEGWGVVIKIDSCILPVGGMEAIVAGGQVMVSSLQRQPASRWYTLAQSVPFHMEFWPALSN